MQKGGVTTGDEDAARHKTISPGLSLLLSFNSRPKGSPLFVELKSHVSSLSCPCNIAGEVTLESWSQAAVNACHDVSCEHAYRSLSRVARTTSVTASEHHPETPHPKTTSPKPPPNPPSIPQHAPTSHLTHVPKFQPNPPSFQNLQELKNAHFFSVVSFSKLFKTEISPMCFSFEIMGKSAEF